MYYTFSDGSGNSYVLDNSNLSFKPITKKESSSGVYDGGLPFEKKLDKDTVVKLIDTFERAIWNKSDHTFERTKGSGAIGKRSGQKMDVINLKFGSESMKNIEDELTKLWGEL